MFKIIPIVLFSFLIAITNGTAQEKGVIIFKSFEDYQNGIGEKFVGDFRLRSYSHSFLDKTLIFKNQEEPKNKIKVYCHNIWGFSFNGLLFRIDKSGNTPLCVSFQGKYCYYENAISMLHHLVMHDTNEPQLEWDLNRYGAREASSWGYLAYISESINSDIFNISTQFHFKKLLKKQPQFREVYSCIYSVKGKNKQAKMRICVRSFPDNTSSK